MTQHLPLSNFRNSLEKLIRKSSDAGYFKHTLKTIIDLHNSIADQMLSTKDDTLLKRYIRVFQAQIRLAMDLIPEDWADELEINEAFNTRTGAGRRQNVCYECYRILKELQYAYPAYFDMHVIVPVLYAEMEKKQYFHKWMLINTMMGDKCDQFKSIWQKVESIMKPIWLNQSHYCYHEIEYAWDLLRQIYTCIQEYGAEYNANSFFNQLLYMNFNHMEFVTYVINELQKKLDSIILDHEKTALLERMRLEYSCVLVRDNLAADPHHDALRVILINWIDLELDTLQS